MYLHPSKSSTSLTTTSLSSLLKQTPLSYPSTSNTITPTHQKSSILQFRPLNHTPKKPFKPPLSSPISTLPESSHITNITNLTFQSPKQQSKIKSLKPQLSKTMNITNKQVYIPSIFLQNDSMTIDGFSELSSLDNIEMKNQYLRLFQEELGRGEKKKEKEKEIEIGMEVEEITFRNKNRVSEDRRGSRLQTNRLQQYIPKNPQQKPTEKKNKTSIQFSLKSPKHTSLLNTPLHQLKSLKPYNPIDHHRDHQQLPLKNLIQKISILQKQKLVYDQERREFIYKQNNLVLEVVSIREIIKDLNQKLVLKQEEMDRKESVLMEEIYQLIRDKEGLERKLGSMGKQQEGVLGGEREVQKMMQEIEEKMNDKDQEINRLQTTNKELQSKITYIQLQSYIQQSLASKPDSQNLLPFSLINPTISSIQQQLQLARNTLSLQTLKQATEIQTLKITFEAEKVIRQNQMLDLREEIELLKGRNVMLKKEVEEKDRFIMDRIKFD